MPAFSYSAASAALTAKAVCCGELMVDFRQNNLHVVGFSQAAHQKMGLDDLESHLHYLPDIPEDTILQWSDIID